MLAAGLGTGWRRCRRCAPRRRCRWPATPLIRRQLQLAGGGRHHPRGRQPAPPAGDDHRGSSATAPTSAWPSTYSWETDGAGFGRRAAPRPRPDRSRSLPDRQRRHAHRPRPAARWPPRTPAVGALVTHGRRRGHGRLQRAAGRRRRRSPGSSRRRASAERRRDRGAFHRRPGRRTARLRRPARRRRRRHRARALSRAGRGDARRRPRVDRPRRDLPRRRARRPSTCARCGTWPGAEGRPLDRGAGTTHRRVGPRRGLGLLGRRRHRRAAPR